MIKIQLLPSHIVERRRVKVWAALVALVLIVETLGFCYYVWAPAPFSLSTKLKDAQREQAEVDRQYVEVQGIENEVRQTVARYQGKGTWVNFVADSDKLPEMWVQYFEMLNEYIPADVVLNGIPLPSGTTLTLSGATSDVMAAVRWYLNMLRCEMVEPQVQFVDLQTTVDLPGQGRAGGGNPRMQHAVTIRVQLKPEYLRMYNLPPGVPADMGGGGRVGGRGGGRMGMGGRGMRGGRGGGMRGGRGGGMRGGRGGMRGGARGGM